MVDIHYRNAHRSEGSGYGRKERVETQRKGMSVSKVPTDLNLRVTYKSSPTDVESFIHSLNKYVQKTALGAGGTEANYYYDYYYITKAAGK